MKKFILGVVIFLSSSLIAIIPAISDTSISGNSSIQGKIVSIDKVSHQLTVVDSSTGANTTIPVSDASSLNNVKNGDTVSVALTSDGSVQGITKQ